MGAGRPLFKRNDMMENDIKIDYDGEYPCLCMGNLTVTINGKAWKFPEYCLRSGGSVWFDDDLDEHVEMGEWSVNEWPDGFPEELKDEVLDAINREIPPGCCGGCV